METINLYTEKFRPKTLEEMVLPKRIRSIFEGKTELNQHYLFYSNIGGAGKTTLAKAIANMFDPDGQNTLYINISDESGVDTIRNKIKNFGSNGSVFGGSYKQRIIILDEMDKASEQFYAALRGVMEDDVFIEKVRFIGTCNHINKIPTQVSDSRFTAINFQAEDKEEEKEILKGLVKRTYSIMKKVGFNVETDVVVKFVKLNFPDMRKILNKIQLLKNQNITDVTLDIVKKSAYSFSELFELCISKPNPEKNYSEIIDVYKGKSDEIIVSLGEEFPKWLLEKKAGYSTELMDVINIVNEGSYKRRFVIDEMVNLLDIIFKIQKVFNSK